MQRERGPLVIAAAMLIGCSGTESLTQLEAIHSTPVMSVEITSAATRLVVGTRLELFVTVRGPGGAVLTDRQVSWSSDNSSVAVVSSAMFDARSTHIPDGVVLGTGAGTATIAATVDGRSAQIVLTVLVPTMSQSVVIVDAFTVIAFQYPSAPGQVYWAPQVHLKETTGAHSADVLAIEFVVPGRGSLVKCGTFMHVAAGQSADLFNEIYGDYPLTFGPPADGGPAPDSMTALVTVLDDAGLAALLTARGPIVPGTLPTTYTGGTPSPWWSC